MRMSLNRLKKTRSRGIKYRQLLAVLLCICMGLTICPDMQAAQRDTVNPRQLSDHSHAVCGDKSGCTLCSDGEHSQITYTAVNNAEEFVQAAKDGGNYYLADDIEIIGGGDEIYGTSKAVVNIENDFNLCMNGHTCSIKIVSDKGTSYYAMLLKGAANFNLCDCSEGKTGKLINNSFEEGKGTQNAPHVIYSEGSGDITMYGGTVSNNNNSWVLNCVRSTGKQIVDGAVFEGSYVLSGKKIIVKSGTVGSSGGAGNVITSPNITVEGGTVNGFVQLNSSGEGKFTGGVVNGYLSLGSNSVSEVGNITINALKNQYLGGINAANSSNVKVYLYDSPTFTGMAKNREIYCKASDTAEGATIIPHSRDNSKNYTGTSIITILLSSSSAQLGQYVMQDLPSADYLNKFKLSNTVNFVLRLVDKDKNLKLDRIININTTNFPDDSFRKFVSESYDDDNDGKLYESDVSTVETMDISNKGIRNLKGIEYFTGITSLNCSKNQLAALDLSKNTKLNTLNASDNVVSIGSCTEYDLTALPGMDTEKVSSVNGAALSDGKLTEFTGTGKITYTYDVGNSGVDNPQFSLKYDVQEHQHQYGKWTLTKEPTEIAEGTAERTCSECKEKEIKNNVPNLKDPIWQKGDYVAPTRDDEGSQSYTSTEYGTVKVVIPALGITEEEKVAEAKKVVEDALAGMTVTNNTTREDIQSVIDNALTEAGISSEDVTVTVGNVDKTDATTSEDGKIGGSVSIVSKKDESVKDSVPVNKTITKLPKTEEEKVAEAKKVVEEALAGMTVTNNTTREDIQSVIDNALTEAGISSEDVTVTVGNVDKTDATTSEDGKIGGSVSIVSKKDESVKDSVPVNKTITKLPKTEEEKVAEAKKVVEEALAGITAANDTTREDIQSIIDNALTEAGISSEDVTVTVGDIAKTDATTSEEGKISGSVSIVSKKDENVKDSVPVNKTITKLPKTEEEKVAEAKKVVEEALAGITATNNTTREDIQSVIDNALTEAGISSEDVTVTVGDIDKTDATTSEDGKIGGSVSIVSKKDENVKDSVPINKTIIKLPKTEEEKVAEAKKVVEEALAEITATNNTTREDIQSVIDNALTEAGISSEDVTVTVEDIAKTDATTSEDGKISGSVSIVSKKDENVKDSVPVNKTIIKLPKTEEEKVAEAKKVVEEALAGITAANDTTREDIQSVIDNALTEAGISSEDVTATVGDVAKTDATTSEDGKISGSVSIVSKKDENVKDSVLINKIIARLSGNISKDVEKGENAPDTVLVSSEKELADILLTAEEKELVGSGTDIKFVLDVKNAEDTVSSGDKEAVQSALNGYEKGQYLDIALFKVVGQNRSAISETAKKITLTLAIPDKLKNTDGRKTRKYAVIRVHNGIADILTDMDDNDDTVTIMTDRFSAYAIVYKDEGGNGNNNNDNNNSNTGDNNGNTVGNADTGGSNKTGDNNNTGANSLTEKEKQEKRELVLNGKLKASQTGSQINITWGKVSGADGYDVYVQYCGMKFNAKSLNQIKSGKNVKITVKKVNGKKLNLKKNYKIYIRAYKMSGGKKKTLAKTIIAHIVGKNNKKYTNVKAIKIKKSSYRLKVGKTARIKAKTVLVNKNKKQLSNAHAKQFRYATSNKKVAVVSKKGKIRAVGTGSCIIYVYARNGYAKKVKVTVSD